MQTAGTLPDSIIGPARHSGGAAVLQLDIIIVGILLQRSVRFGVKRPGRQRVVGGGESQDVLIREIPAEKIAGIDQLILVFRLCVIIDVLGVAPRRPTLRRNGIVGHGVGLRLQTSFGVQISPFEILGVGRVVGIGNISADNHHTGAGKPVLFELAVQPHGGVVVAVIKGHGEDGAGTVRGGGDLRGEDFLFHRLFRRDNGGAG